MPRFVILEHDHPCLHWDFMLEVESRLRTWRLAEPPTDSASIRAEALPDHRVRYLDYEGPISGGRGVVRRWDRGTYETLFESDVVLRIDLRGSKVCGFCSIGPDEHGGLVLQLQSRQFPA